MIRFSMLERRKIEKRGLKQITPRMIAKAKKSERKFAKLFSIIDRFSIKIAKSCGIKDSSVSIDDLIQEGRIVAWKCLQNYSPKKETLFTSYFCQALKNHFGHLRGGLESQKRVVNTHLVPKIKLNWTSSDEEDRELTPLEKVENDKARHQLDIFFSSLILEDILKILPKKGKRVCKLILQGKTFKEIGEIMKKEQYQIRAIFKKEVVDFVKEAKKLGVL